MVKKNTLKKNLGNHGADGSPEPMEGPVLFFRLLGVLLSV